MSIHRQSTDFIGSPFNARTAPLNIKQLWYAWDKYHVVYTFRDFESEIKAIRESAATIDMSPLSKYDIVGPDAQAYLDYLMTRDISKQEVGQIYYSPWCNEHGKIVGDGIITRLDENIYRISADPQIQWLQKHATGFDVDIIDISEDYGILSLQGPKSQQVLESVTGQDLSNLAFSRLRQVKIDGVTVDITRQGFTGELGYELWMKANDAVAVWDATYANAEQFGLRPAGVHAHDVARMEAGLVIVGPDYTGAGIDSDRGSSIYVDCQDEKSPFEIRLGDFVHLYKKEFIGKESLKTEKENGIAKKMLGITINWSDIAKLYTKQGLPPVVVPTPIWYPLNIFNDDKIIGRATSVAWSPAANSIAGFAFVESKYGKPGTNVLVEFNAGKESGLVNAEIVKLPFIDMKRAG